MVGGVLGREEGRTAFGDGGGLLGEGGDMDGLANNRKVLDYVLSRKKSPLLRQNL